MSLTIILHHLILVRMMLHVNLVGGLTPIQIHSHSRVSVSTATILVSCHTGGSESSLSQHLRNSLSHEIVLPFLSRMVQAMVILLP